MWTNFGQVNTEDHKSSGSGDDDDGFDDFNGGGWADASWTNPSDATDTQTQVNNQPNAQQEIQSAIVDQQSNPFDSQEVFETKNDQNYNITNTQEAGFSNPWGGVQIDDKIQDDDEEAIDWTTSAVFQQDSQNKQIQSNIHNHQLEYLQKEAKATDIFPTTQPVAQFISQKLEKEEKKDSDREDEENGFTWQDQDQRVSDDKNNQLGLVEDQLSDNDNGEDWAQSDFTQLSNNQTNQQVELQDTQLEVQEQQNIQISYQVKKFQHQPHNLNSDKDISSNLQKEKQIVLQNQNNQNDQQVQDNVVNQIESNSVRDDKLASNQIDQVIDSDKNIVLQGWSSNPFGDDSYEDKQAKNQDDNMNNNNNDDQVIERAGWVQFDQNSDQQNQKSDKYSQDSKQEEEEEEKQTTQNLNQNDNIITQDEILEQLEVKSLPSEPQPLEIPIKINLREQNPIQLTETHQANLLTQNSDKNPFNKQTQSVQQENLIIQSNQYQNEQIPQQIDQLTPDQTPDQNQIIPKTSVNSHEDQLYISQDNSNSVVDFKHEIAYKQTFSSYEDIEKFKAESDADNQKDIEDLKNFDFVAMQKNFDEVQKVVDQFDQKYDDKVDDEDQQDNSLDQQIDAEVEDKIGAQIDQQVLQEQQYNQDNIEGLDQKVIQLEQTEELKLQNFSKNNQIQEEMISIQAQVENIDAQNEIQKQIQQETEGSQHLDDCSQEKNQINVKIEYNEVNDVQIISQEQIKNIIEDKDQRFEQKQIVSDLQAYYDSGLAMDSAPQNIINYSNDEASEEDWASAAFQQQTADIQIQKDIFDQGLIQHHQSISNKQENIVQAKDTSLVDQNLNLVDEEAAQNINKTIIDEQQNEELIHKPQTIEEFNPWGSSNIEDQEIELKDNKDELQSINWAQEGHLKIDTQTKTKKNSKRPSKVNSHQSGAGSPYEYYDEEEEIEIEDEDDEVDQNTDQQQVSKKVQVIVETTQDIDSNANYKDNDDGGDGFAEFDDATTNQHQQQQVLQKGWNEEQIQDKSDDKSDDQEQPAWANAFGNQNEDEEEDGFADFTDALPTTQQIEEDKSDSQPSWSQNQDWAASSFSQGVNQNQPSLNADSKYQVDEEEDEDGFEDFEGAEADNFIDNDFIETIGKNVNQNDSEQEINAQNQQQNEKSEKLELENFDEEVDDEGFDDFEDAQVEDSNPTRTVEVQQVQNLVEQSSPIKVGQDIKAKDPNKINTLFDVYTSSQQMKEYLQQGILKICKENRSSEYLSKTHLTQIKEIIPQFQYQSNDVSNLSYLNNNSAYKSNFNSQKSQKQHQNLNKNIHITEMQSFTDKQNKTHKLLVIRDPLNQTSKDSKNNNNNNNNNSNNQSNQFKQNAQSASLSSEINTQYDLTVNDPTIKFSINKKVNRANEALFSLKFDLSEVQQNQVLQSFEKQIKENSQRNQNFKWDTGKNIFREKIVSRFKIQLPASKQQQSQSNQSQKSTQSLENQAFQQTTSNTKQTAPQASQNQGPGGKAGISINTEANQLNLQHNHPDSVRPSRQQVKRQMDFIDENFDTQYDQDDDEGDDDHRRRSDTRERKDEGNGEKKQAASYYSDEEEQEDEEKKQNQGALGGSGVGDSTLIDDELLGGFNKLPSHQVQQNNQDFVKDTFAKFGLNMNLYSNDESQGAQEARQLDNQNMGNGNGSMGMIQSHQHLKHKNKKVQAILDIIPDYGFLLDTKLALPQAFFIE